MWRCSCGFKDDLLINANSVLQRKRNERKSHHHIICQILWNWSHENQLNAQKERKNIWFVLLRCFTVWQFEFLKWFKVVFFFFCRRRRRRRTKNINKITSCTLVRVEMKGKRSAWVLFKSKLNPWKNIEPEPRSELEFLNFGSCTVLYSQLTNILNFHKNSKSFLFKQTDLTVHWYKNTHADIVDHSKRWEFQIYFNCWFYKTNANKISKKKKEKKKLMWWYDVYNWSRWKHQPGPVFSFLFLYIKSF